MKWLRRGLIAALAAVLLASPIWGPLLLREASWFQVQRVEITGNRFLPAQALLDASGIDLGQNVWDPAEVWETALRAHPGVQDAEVTRRLPNTLRVRVMEKQPVAFVTGNALLPVTASGEPFPVDPSVAPLDLPLVRGDWPDETGATRALLHEVARLAELDPGLLAEISDVRAAGQGDAMVLTHRVGEILLPMDPSLERLAELHAVLLELDHHPTSATRRTGRAQVDARFAAQIVVRILSSV